MLLLHVVFCTLFLRVAVVVIFSFSAFLAINTHSLPVDRGGGPPTKFFTQRVHISIVCSFSRCIMYPPYVMRQTQSLGRGGRGGRERKRGVDVT